MGRHVGSGGFLMGRETPKDREARIRAWWASLTPEQRAAEVRAGHVRVRLPEAQPKELTPNQRKAARRRARGK